MLHIGDALTLPVMAIRSLSGGDGASWATQDVIEGKPRLQWMGPAASSLSLSLYLHVAFIAPRPTYRALVRLMATGSPYQVWTDAGSYLGTFVLKDLTWRHQWTLPTGQVIAMAVDVNLGEPGSNDISAPKRPPGVAAYAVPDYIAPPVEDTSRDPSTVSPSEIVRT